VKKYSGICVICETPFEAPNKKQRTCGRACGFKLASLTRTKPDDLFWLEFNSHMSGTDNDDSCWEWQRSRRTHGFPYGMCMRKGKLSATHRLSWELNYGPIPDGLWVLHKCDNPPCCNPKHLFLGTRMDNVADCIRKGRAGVCDGENHPSCKLSDSDVEAIRELRKTGTKLTDIAARYNVSTTTVSRIALGERRSKKTIRRDDTGRS
jgi:hypothetical protein